MRLRSAVALSVSSMALSGLEPMSTHSLAQAQSNARAAGSTVTTLPLSFYQETNLYQITDGKTVTDKIAELRAHPDVLSAEPDYEVEVFRLPTDPGYTQQWHLAKIGSGGAWDEITGSKKVKVCVIDSGARMDHPDLAGNILKGWNVVHGNKNSIQTARDATSNDFNDTLGHGTHVAGLIAAIGNNNKGVSGVTWRIGLLICKFIANSGSGYVFDAITCMRLCRDEGAHIYSNSWGGVEYQDALLAEIQAISDSGGLFVAASGNNGINLDTNPSYPASYTISNLLTVGATTQDDGLADFSNYGSKSVDLAAPGVNLLSTTADLDYGEMSGTSMAAPVVSGAAALLQAMAMNNYNTQLAPQKLRQLLMRSVDVTGWGPNYLLSGGRLNVFKAVEMLKKDLEGGGQPSTPTPVPTTTPNPTPTPTPTFSPGKDPNGSTGVIMAPKCGTSVIQGQSAVQSSTSGTYGASAAVDGKCGNDLMRRNFACSVTDPAKSDPWWSASLPSKSEVVAVSVTTRADCCWTSIGGAVILVGDSTWTGSGSRANFQECGRIPDSGIPQGQRMTVKCARTLTGSRVAIYLPKSKTSLVLCEVDVSLKAKNKNEVKSPPPKRNRKAISNPTL